MAQYNKKTINKMASNKTIVLPAMLEKQTAMAYCLFFGKLIWKNGGLEKEVLWLPKSLARFDKLNNQVTIPEWLAIKRKLL